MTAPIDPTQPRPYTYGPIAELNEWNDCIPPWGAFHAACWWVRVASSLPPPAHVVGASLPMLAHEAARRGYRLGAKMARPALHCALVGPSGAGKSTSMRAAMELYRDHLRREGGSFVDPWVMLEGSLPGILEQLSMRHESHFDQTTAILFSEEFTRLLDSKDNIAEVLNQVFDGVTVTRHLRQYREMEAAGNAAPASVTNPAISALVATTYAGVETATTKRQASGGFYSRLLWFTGLPGYVSLDESPHDIERTGALGVWESWSAHLHGAELSGRSRVLDLAPVCNRLLEEMVQEINRALVDHPEDPHNAVRLRGLGLARKLAMLFAFSRGEILAELDDTMRAVRLVNRITGLAETLAERWLSATVSQATPEIAAVGIQRPLLDVIAAAGDAGVRKSVLYKIAPVKSQLDAALASLVERDLISEIRIAPQGRGRPAMLYKALAAITPPANSGGVVLPFEPPAK